MTIISFTPRFALKAAAALLLALPLAPVAAAQSGPDADDGSRILLVLPFDNHSGQPSLEWVREAAPELLGARFTSAGFAPMSRVDRVFALDHLGLPQGFQPSRASALKLAQTLDADSIIVGSFSVTESTLTAQAQIVDVPHLRIGQLISASGELRDLPAVFSTLAWKLTRELDPPFSVSQESFVKASSGIRLEAFEQYVRGITQPDHGERLRHLDQAVKLSPEFVPAWMALGRELYSSQQYDEAAQAFARVGRNDDDALEAGFYRGISLLFSGNYVKAEEAFTGVARVLPLAPVINNQAIARSRRNQDASALFRQAAADDPSNADYHFNLAVSLKRHSGAAEALGELALALRLRPFDSEALALEHQWKEPAAQVAAEGEAKADPLERIARNFDAQAFRQAAQMIDQMESARLVELTPQERAKALAAKAEGFLNRGLLLEAERLYLSAVATDEKLPDAHAGLALVHERSGDAVAARREARLTLEIAPSADAHLVLGRLFLAGNRLGDAKTEAAAALKLEPQNPAAIELRQQIEAKEAAKP